MQPNMENITTRALKALSKEYVAVGKTRVRSWHAWLVIGLAVGILAGVLFVANRSGEFEKGSAQVIGPYPTPVPPTDYILTIASNPRATVNLGRGSGNKVVSQTFIAPTDMPLQSVKLALTQKGTPTQQITVSIRETRTGADLATTILTPQISSSPTPPMLLSDAESTEPAQTASILNMVATFKSSATLTIGKQYFLVLTANTTNSNNFYRVAVDNKNPYAGGKIFVGSDGRGALDAVASMLFAKPTITVLSPNGEEQLKVGDSYTISWSRNNLPSDGYTIIDILDTRFKGDVGEAIAQVFQLKNYGDTNYTWVIPENVNGYMKWNGGNVYKISVRVLDGSGKQVVYDSSDAPFSIVSGLSITTSSLPNGTVGVAYSAQINSAGAGLDAQWSVSSGALPPGLNFLTTPRTCPPIGSCHAPSGFIEGIPTTAGTYTFTVTVNSGGQTASKQFTISIIPPISTKFNKTLLVVGLVDSNISLYSRSGYTAMDILGSNTLEIVDEWGISYPTLKVAKKWFQEEGLKYGKSADINYILKGPYNFDSSNMSTYPSLSSFADILNQNNLLLDDYDGAFILFFHSGTAKAVSYQSGNFSYIDVMSADTSFDMINIVKTIMHESTHMFGAYDLYSARGFACDMELGVPEPARGYNQTQACIMCGAIVIGPTTVQAITNLSEMVLCNETARQIKW